MAQGEGNLEQLAKAVLDEARLEAEKVLTEARSEAERIMQHAQEQADAEREGILQHASQEAARIRRESTATAELWSRTLQMKHRESLLDNAFETTRQQLHTVQEWSNYSEIVNDLLRDALTRLAVKTAKVRADKTTQKLLADGIIEKMSREMGVELQLGEPLENGTGVIVETLDGRRRYDNTLETRLSRMKNALRSPVYHILMGEPL